MTIDEVFENSAYKLSNEEFRKVAHFLNLAYNGGGGHLK